MAPFETERTTCKAGSAAGHDEDLDHLSQSSTTILLFPAPIRVSQTRIVYFDEALMANDADLMGRLGLTQYFAEPLLDIPYIRLTGNNTGIRRDVPSRRCCRIQPPSRVKKGIFRRIPLGIPMDPFESPI